MQIKVKRLFRGHETKEELQNKLNLRVQEPNESIEAFARDVKLIGHKAYPKGEPELLESM